MISINMYLIRILFKCIKNKEWRRVNIWWDNGCFFFNLFIIKYFLIENFSKFLVGKI